MQSTLKYFPSWRRLAQVLMLAGAAALTACGGGSGPPPAAPTALAVGYGAKAFNFTWTGSAEATSYQLLEDVDGAAGPGDFVVVGKATTPSIAFVPPGLLHTRLNARYAVQACNDDGCGSNSTPVQVEVNKAIGYFKASNTGAVDRFGDAIALSADGSTLAVGARNEDSNATGVNGDSANNLGNDTGAVYVFTRVAGAWTQQAYLKASNTGDLDFFGSALALSADGNTLSVGARGEASINGVQGDDSAPGAGAVYVFTRTGGAWAQQAYVKPSNVSADNAFGTAVTLSADGNTLAAGAPGENTGEGTAYTFTRTGNVWTQQAWVNAPNAEAGDHFGKTVALSGDGSTLAIGAPDEASSATAINGDGSDNMAPGAGAVYIFARTGNTWPLNAFTYIKASNAGQLDSFGSAVALSDDGNTLAVGAPGESSNAIGINGDKTDNGASKAGAVYIFGRTGAIWAERAYIKASNTGTDDQFGSTVALSKDGNTLAVAAIREGSSATGLQGDQSNSADPFAGAAYVFKRAGTAWAQQAYVKASNTPHFFGLGLALSADGNTLAVGTSQEPSNATGINGNQADNSMMQAGAVYVY